jgi:hypothetical protein
MRNVSFHEALRPSWQCAGCGAPWPCITRRRQLRAEYSREPELAALMEWYLTQAGDDLPGASPAGLDARFVAWVGKEDATHDVA